MRIRTLVPIALVAVLAIAYLPTSHSQTSANAPQEYKLTLTPRNEIDRYLVERSRENASRKRDYIGEEIVDTGKNYFGVPYCWGGKSARCFDCSGFIQYVYNKNGIELPRTADEQLKSMVIISREEAREGDLVFFLYRNGYAHHAGIYVGNNMILHSPRPGRKVRLEEIWSTKVVFAREQSMLIPVPPQAEAILEDGITY